MKRASIILLCALALVVGILAGTCLDTDARAGGSAVELQVWVNGHTQTIIPDVAIPTSGPGSPQWDVFEAYLWGEIQAARTAATTTTTLSNPNARIHRLTRWLPIRSH